MSKPKVSVIIVNYNTAKEIGKCLQSVYGIPTTAVNFEVIVVDNASTDNSIERIENLKLKVENLKLIRNSINLGFAKANNIAAKVATGNFFFFLNPDTEIKRDTISKLLGLVGKNPNVILGPRILNQDGSVQGSCYNLPTILGAISEYWLGQKGAYEKFAPRDNQPVKVEAIVGAAMFMSKATFEKLEGFDEHYFLYYEDLDFCRRASRLGIQTYYYPLAVVYHHLGKSGGNMEHLKKSAQIYHGTFEYFLITFIIRVELAWSHFLGKISS